MENLIGRKVRGFKFTSRIGLAYVSDMDYLVSIIGTIKATDSVAAEVEFLDPKDTAMYPLDQVKDHLVDEVPNKEEVQDTPSYYDNTHGTIYKVGGQRKWNHYLFDIVKRLERAEKKGEFMSDLDKAIKAIELYRSEAEDYLKTQYEKPNE